MENIIFGNNITVVHKAKPASVVILTGRQPKGSLRSKMTNEVLDNCYVFSIFYEEYSSKTFIDTEESDKGGNNIK